MSDSEEPAFKLFFLPQLPQSFIDRNKRLLGEVATIFRVKSFAPKEANYLSVMSLEEPVEVFFNILPLFDLAN